MQWGLGACKQSTVLIIMFVRSSLLFDACRTHLGATYIIKRTNIGLQLIFNKQLKTMTDNATSKSKSYVLHVVHAM